MNESQEEIQRRLLNIDWKNSESFVPYFVEALKRQKRRSWQWLKRNFGRLELHELVEDMSTEEIDEVGAEIMALEAVDHFNESEIVNLAIALWRILKVYFLQGRDPSVFLSNFDQYVKENESTPLALMMDEYQLTTASDLLEYYLDNHGFGFGGETDEFYLAGGEQYLRDIIERYQARRRRARMEAMAVSQGAVLERAKALEEEEAEKQRNRRQSDPKVAKCTNMNKVCKYTPLDMEDWCEHEANLYYGPDEAGKCFDAVELLKHFDAQLTIVKYGNPYPQYPTDPWTREAIPLKMLLEFAAFCRERRVHISGEAPTFKKFLNLLVTRPDMDLAPIQGPWLEEVVDKVVNSAQIGGSWFSKIFG